MVLIDTHHPLVLSHLPSVKPRQRIGEKIRARDSNYCDELAPPPPGPDAAVGLGPPSPAPAAAPRKLIAPIRETMLLPTASTAPRGEVNDGPCAAVS